MHQDLPKPIEEPSSQTFRLLCTGNKFFEALRNSSSVEEQIHIVSELLSQKQLSQKELIVATCFTIFKQQSTLASYLIKQTNIHDKIEKFSVITPLPHLKNAFREYHFKWTPLCFAVNKWNQPIIEALRNKGASFKDIQSSTGFLDWLTDTTSIEDRDYRLSVLGQLGFPGCKEISETDSLLAHSSKKDCTIQ